MFRRLRLLPVVAMVVSAVMAALAQSTLPDPRHMRVEYEDERLRVIRLTLEPNESTGVIELNERINVCATDGKIKVTFNGQDLGVSDVESGNVRHEPAASFSIENVGTREFQTVITEFKGQFAKATPATPVATPTAVARKQQPNENAKPVPENKSQISNPAPAEPPRSIPAQPATEKVQPESQTSAPQPSEPEPTGLNVDGAKVLFVNGTELAYIERGSGPAVVLVHDTLGDYRAWAAQLTALSRNYRVIAYSRRYHYPNHSNGKEHDYNYDVNAKDLADFIRALNAGPVRLVGFGYGASIAAMVASEHPEMVKALALTEPGFEQMLDPTSATRSRYAREEIYGIIRKPLTKDRPEKGVQVYVDWLGYQSWAAMNSEEQFRKTQNANALHAQTLDATAPNFSCATAKKIGARTLILSGQRRSPNSAEMTGVLSACIPNAARATVANSGAAVYIDNPAEADKLLMEFLAKQ